MSSVIRRLSPGCLSLLLGVACDSTAPLPARTPVAGSYSLVGCSYNSNVGMAACGIGGSNQKSILAGHFDLLADSVARRVLHVRHVIYDYDSWESVDSTEGRWHASNDTIVVVWTDSLAGSPREPTRAILVDGNRLRDDSVFGTWSGVYAWFVRQ